MHTIITRAASHPRFFSLGKQSLCLWTRRLATMTPPIRPRKFAPLKPEKKTEGDPRPTLKGIVFDVDGTLCLPQNYMFGEMRSALGIDKGTDILDHIYSLPDAEQNEAQEKVRDIERAAMKKQKPQAGLVKLMDYLDSRGLKKGICTRNFDAPVEHLLNTFLPSSKFSPVITREFRPPKPDPAGILHIAKQWMHEDGGDSLIMVGDSIDDMTAGFRAGAATVLLINDVNKHLAEHQHTDLVVKQLDDLIEILENGFEGRVEADQENVDAKGLVEEAAEKS
ncbi:HAD-like domain-containing protein [Boeremia exigua]|uniref:HAD-like domain-containing protein n=1 Tax=Boeremia exigua TaxID=749465 RepID=UPI001E8D12F3|nr:HAD-like domain-containing protein [Boeremia exigua]KAH6633536.1 HAD-like domain-containing protein [Boeremia exigua]